MAALAGISPFLTPLQRAKQAWAPWPSLAPLLFNSNVERVVHPLSSVRTTLPSDAFARVSAVLCDASGRDPGRGLQQVHAGVWRADIISGLAGSRSVLEHSYGA